MNDWILGKVQARGMELEASCHNENCRRFWRFDLPRLIEQVGSDYKISDIPPMTCQECGGPLKIELAVLHQKEGGEAE